MGKRRTRPYTQRELHTKEVHARQAMDAPIAMADYKKAQRRVLDRMAELRALRRRQISQGN